MATKAADHSARWLASVHLKNTVVRHWRPRRNTGCAPLPVVAGSTRGRRGHDRTPPPRPLLSPQPLSFLQRPPPHRPVPLALATYELRRTDPHVWTADPVAFPLTRSSTCGVSCFSRSARTTTRCMPKGFTGYQGFLLCSSRQHARLGPGRTTPALVSLLPAFPPLTLRPHRHLCYTIDSL